MRDWLELCQAVIVGLIFSFLIAKLISVAISFTEDNAKVVRESDLSISLDASKEAGEGSGEFEKKMESFLEDDSDWEGIECTELDDAFGAAVAFVAAVAADRKSVKVSNDLQLQLYGLYKIATEGPCIVPQPSAFKMTARAKWNAWQRLGTMPPEEAMQKYIMIISELYPSWADGSTKVRKELMINCHLVQLQGDQWVQFLAVLSMRKSQKLLCKTLNAFRMYSICRVITVRQLEPIHVFAREGQPAGLLTLITKGASVNSRDSEGRTALHWAVDRGHLDAVKTLLDNNAHVNAKDNEGQTPLHYAALCEREEIAKLLVSHHADPSVKDNFDSLPLDLEPRWGFLTVSS